MVGTIFGFSLCCAQESQYLLQESFYMCLVPRFLHLVPQFFADATQGTILDHLALVDTSIVFRGHMGL